MRGDEYVIKNMNEKIINDFGCTHASPSIRAVRLTSVSALYRAQAQHTSVALAHWEELYLSTVAS